MIAKTKKYKVSTTIFVKMAFLSLLKKEWWYIFGPLALGCISFVFPDYKGWFITFAILIPALYLLFWLIQFAGMTQHPKTKVWFEKLSYEIDNRQVLIKVNPKMGMPLQWNSVKRASKTKDGFVLNISKAQILYLPFNIFGNQNEIRFVESILKGKKLLK